MHFGNPNFFVFFIIIPFVILIFYISKKVMEKTISKFVSKSIQKKLFRNVSYPTKSLKNFLLVLCLIFLIFASAKPRWDKKLQIFEEKGLDIVIALDVSKSMLAEDISPNRIQRAKNAFVNFVNQLSGDRVGLVLFSGNSFVQCPLTSDYSALKMFATMIDVGIIPQEGTNIASALEKSISLLAENTKSKVVILITDGENLQGDLQPQIKKAKKKNIIIYNIGVGTIEGSPIPISESNYLKDKEGNIILTKLDVANLQKIANETGGQFFQVSSSQSEIKEMLAYINKLEKEKISSKQFSKYKEQYHYFILIALIILIVEFIIFERKKL